MDFLLVMSMLDNIIYASMLDDFYLYSEFDVHGIVLFLNLYFIFKMYKFLQQVFNVRHWDLM